VPKTRPAITRRGFSANRCHRVEYEFLTSADKFKLDEFKKEFPRVFKGRPREGASLNATASTRNPRLSDYHAHFQFSIRKERIHVGLHYVAGSLKPPSREKGPYAEDVMQWLGSFFLNPRASAHVLALFEHSSKEWQTALPIPIKLTLRGRTVEVKGMFLNVRAASGRPADLWVDVAEGRTTCLVGATKIVDFSHFGLYSEIRWFLEVADTVIERGAK
jgi:hypothetical protein